MSDATETDAAEPAVKEGLFLRLIGYVRRFFAREAVNIEPKANIKAVLDELKPAFFAANLFSAFINILALSGSLFMLQVYDRVIPSHNTDTLWALSFLVLMLYGFNTALENSRSRLFSRCGWVFELSLRDAVFALNINAGLPGRLNLTSAPFRDLEQVRTFLTTGGPSSLFDLLWMPIFLIFMFLLNVWVGVFALVCIFILVVLTYLNDRSTSPLQAKSVQTAHESTAMNDVIRQSAETLVPLGMGDTFRREWGTRNEIAAENLILAADMSGTYSSLSRFLRNSMQSMILALGAYLVIQGKASGGIMIAASILLGRALAPVEAAIGQWRNFATARQAYNRLKEALVKVPKVPGLRLPPPQNTLKVEGLVLGLPNMPKPILAGINFMLERGDSLSVLGPSGAGKSTLVRAIVGALPIARGTIQFDGSTLDQWDMSDAGRFMGYMPQMVELFSGTIAQNIARFRTDASDEAILKAAEIASVDQMIRGFEKGFETDVGPRGSNLSAGQRQRIALARALFDDPFLLVLDEPNSALDNEGEQALLRAINSVRSRGGIVVLVAHRLNVLHSVNKVLIIDNGIQKAFGPRDEVLKSSAKSMASGSDQPHAGGRA